MPQGQALFVSRHWPEKLVLTELIYIGNLLLASHLAKGSESRGERGIIERAGESFNTCAQSLKVINLDCKCSFVQREQPTLSAAAAPSWFLIEEERGVVREIYIDLHWRLQGGRVIWGFGTALFGIE